MKVITVVGARPQFVKAAVLGAEFQRRRVEEVLVHTGQHYDASMSEVFFEQLPISVPSYRLGVGSGPHGVQTGEMMKRLEPVIEKEQPDWAVVFGDTNTTLAGALVAAKLGVPLVHVEAGLRSFDRRMPEETNRIVTDHVADLLCAPNQGAAERLRTEGIEPWKIAVTGDLMIDLVQIVARTIEGPPAIVKRLNLSARNYGVLTIHRAANTTQAAFNALIDGIRRVAMPVVFPVHPRSKQLAADAGVGAGDNILLCEPLPYREMVALLCYAGAVFTDSGGIQKEAFALGVPCVTLREETEWIETLEDGWNVLAGSNSERIAQAAIRPLPGVRKAPYGEGGSARRIAEAMERALGRRRQDRSSLCAS